MKQFAILFLVALGLAGCNGDIEMKSPRQAALERCTEQLGMDTAAIESCVDEALAPDDDDDDARGGMMMRGGM